MMRMPVYQREVTGLAPVQGAKLDTAVPVGGVAALATAAQQLTKQQGELVQKEREIADHQKLTEKQTDLQNNLNGLLEHVASVKDPRNPTEWGGREGQSLSAWFEEQAKALYSGQAAGLNPTQLAKFDSSVLPVMTSMSHHVATNEMALVDRKHHETFLAAVDSAAQTASRTLFDGTGRFSPLAATLGTEEISRLVREEAKRNRWDENRTKMELTKQLTPMHTSVIAQLAKTDPKMAESYFHENRATISTEDQGRLAEAVRIGGEYARGDELFAKVSPGLTAANYEEKLKEVNSSTNLMPATRDHVASKMREVLHAQEMKFRETVKQQEDSVFSVYNGRGPWAAMSGPEFQLLAKTDPSTAARLKSHFSAEARALRNEVSDADKVESMFRFTDLVNGDGFAFYTKQQLEQQLVGMTEQHKLAAISAWSEAKTNPKRFTADNKIIMSEMHDAGLLEDPVKLKTRSEKEAFDSIYRALLLENADRGSRKPLSQEEQSTETKRLIRKVVTGKGWFDRDTTEHTFEVVKRLESEKFKPVRAQILQANGDPNMSPIKVAEIYSSAAAAGKVRPDGFIDPTFFHPAKVTPAQRQKYASWQAPGGVKLGAVDQLRQFAEGAK